MADGHLLIKTKTDLLSKAAAVLSLPETSSQLSPTNAPPPKVKKPRKARNVKPVVPKVQEQLNAQFSSQTTTTTQCSSNDLQNYVICNNVDFVKDVFDAIVLPTITAPTLFEQSIRQHLYRSIFLTTISNQFQAYPNGIQPETLYAVCISTLQLLNLTS